MRVERRPGVGIASDHAGYELKEILKKTFKFKDYGCYSRERCDYPDFARKLCEAILKGEIERGVLVCGSGIGMSIAANRFRGIRAALCLNEDMAKLARRHNDANVLCVGARITSKEHAIKIVKSWLSEGFEGGRHKRRIDKLERIV